MARVSPRISDRKIWRTKGGPAERNRMGAGASSPHLFRIQLQPEQLGCALHEHGADAGGVYRFGHHVSYITIQTGNCMYAAIMHGVVNVIGELPVCMTHDMENGLLGPNPTGALSMVFLAVFSILLFVRLEKGRN